MGARIAVLRIPAALPLLAVLALATVPRTAHAQCSYPVLADDTPQSFSTTPVFAKFTQPAGRWAAAGVRSSGTANWDVGFSLGTAAFPTCLTLPVVASQLTSGVDFVVGDFAAEGSGVRYAPISRTSGSGNGLLEWDSGSRTVSVDAAVNYGPVTPGVLDCWNASLVGGQTYKIWFFSDAIGDYKMYVMKRGVSNSWGSKSTAAAVLTSALTGNPTFTAPSTDTYAFVVTTENPAAAQYSFIVKTCVDPPNLSSRTPVAIPFNATDYVKSFEINPDVKGYPTVAVREGVPASNWDLEIDHRQGAGFAPCDGVQDNASATGNNVELVVGDFSSGVLNPPGTFWANAIGAAFPGNSGAIEYDDGTDSMVVDGPTRYFEGPGSTIVRTVRCNLQSGTDYIVHVANCGVATTHLYVFRPFDTGDPFGGGWSSLGPSHSPVQTVLVTGVNDFTYTPPVSGPYAFVLTNETGETLCWELAVSTCRPRLEMPDRAPITLSTNPILAYNGQALGFLQVRGGWSATAVRPFGAGEDWVLEAFASPGGGVGGPPFGCLSGPLAATTDDGTGSRVDFLARFDSSAPTLAERLGTQHVYPVGFATAGGGAIVEYKMWNTILTLDAPPGFYPTSANDLLEVWNIDLVAGQPYNFLFDPNGPHAELFLLRRPTACAGVCSNEYVPLGGLTQEFRTDKSIVFTPAVSGMYGLVAVNQDGGTGGYWMGVYSTVTGVGAAALGAPELRSASPNPTRGTTRFTFQLPRASAVGLEIVNLAGRIVGRTDDRVYAAGLGEIVWNGRSDDGGALAPGLYFGRLRVDGQYVGKAKLSLVR